MKKFKLGAIIALQVVAVSGSVLAAQIKTFGKLEISSDDNTFLMRFTGRVYYDGNFYKSGSENRHLPSGTYTRSARLGVQGNFHEWEYAVESDFAGEQTELKDAYLRRLIGPGKLTIGQFKVFEGLEELTSFNDVTFIERSYLSSVVPGRKEGVAYNGNHGPLAYAGTVYNTREASEDEARPTNSGIGVVGRGYYAPVNERMMALHFGASFAQERTDIVGADVRVEPAGRAQDYTPANGEEFRFTIFERLDEKATINRFVLEGAGINGPLSVQGEYLTGSAQTHSRIADDFTVWYGQVSYVLTGEWRRYDFMSGEIKRPEPSRAAGAVEIAARYQEARRHKVASAELTLAEFGVTYYANTNVRFMLNYGLAENKLINDSPRLLSFRTQFDF